MTEQLEYMLEAAKQAAKVIMEYYKKGFNVEIKSDDSPVTEADKKADELIRNFLGKRFPDYGFLTEESVDDKSRLDKEYVFIVDPLDGTKDFIERDNQFTVNVALVHRHEVIAGVIVLPAMGEVYYASKGEGSFYIPLGGSPIRIHVSDRTDNLVQVMSAFHQSKRELELINNKENKIVKAMKIGSSIKSCLVARGDADISIKFEEGTKEWDTCASHIIVTEAGGVYAQSDLEEATYNKEDVYNHKGYVAINKIENMVK